MLLEDAEHPQNLILVALNGRGYFLWVEVEEPVGCESVHEVRGPALKLTHLDHSRGLATHQSIKSEGGGITRTLATRLKEKPLHDLSLFLWRGAQETTRIVWVVLGDKIQKDRIALPNWEVVVVMIDESGDLGRVRQRLSHVVR